VGKTLGVTFAVGASVGGTVASAFATVDSRIKTTKGNLKELQAVSAKAGALMTADARLKDAKSRYAANPTAALKTEVADAQRAFNSAERAAKKYNVAVADSTRVHAQATAAVAKHATSLARLQKLQANQARRQELHGQMLGTAATVATVAVPVKLAIDFESSFADVKKVIDFASKEEEKAVQKDIRDLSSKTGLAASGIAGIYAAAGSAKLATSREDLQAFADTVAQMAVAFGMSADEAGQKMASWRSKMGMSQKEVVSLSDAINHLGNNMAADPLKTAEVVERMGAVAKGSGLAAKSIAALSASFVAASPSPEIAATGMKNFLLAMTKGDALSKDQKSALARLGIKNPKKLAAAMQKDAEGTIMSVMQAIKRIPKAQQGAILSELFGSESLGAIQPLLENLDTLKNAFGFVAKEQDFAGSMSKEYAARSQTTENALKRLRRAAESLAIGLGSTLLPGITVVAEAGVALLSPVIALAERFPEVTTAVFAVAGGLVALKVAALTGGYAATILSDGWTVAKGIFIALNPRIVAQKAVLLAHSVAAKASAVASFVIAAAQKAYSIALALTNPRIIASTVAMVAHKAVSLALAVSTKIVTVAQWALNAAMSANPIGLIVVAVAALAAGLYWLYNNCEPVRTAIDAVWKVVKVVGQNVLRVLAVPFAVAVNLIKQQWEPLSAWMGEKWTAIKGASSKAWEAVSGAASWCWDGIKSVWAGAASFFGGIWDGISSRAGAMWEAVKTPAVAFFEWISGKFKWVAGKFQWLANGWATAKGWISFGDDEEEKPQSQPAVEQTAAAVNPAAQMTVASSSPTAAAAPAVAANSASAKPSTSSASSASSAPAPAARPSRPSSPAGAGAPQVNITIPVTLNGVPAADIGKVLVAAIKNQESELEAYFSKFLERIAANQKRLAYDS